MPDLMIEITSDRLVPVVVLDDAKDAPALADALVAGGLPVAEVTLRTAAGLPAIAAISRRSDILVGAGTVCSAAEVDDAHKAGARFVVSPGLSEAVVTRCQSLGLPVFPGAATATEVQRAMELGVSVCKFFPAATSGGVAALAALSGPFTDIRFVPTGGIGPANLPDYLSLPCVAAVGGSWMVPRASIKAGNFDEITRLTREAVTIASDAP